MAELPLLESAIATTEYCRYCLMCRHVCPVGIVTHEEKFTPHGWGLTIASVKRGLLEWNRETVDALYTCADCGMCQSSCATDQPLPDAIAAARAQVVALGLAPEAVAAVRHSLEAHSTNAVEHAPILQGEVALFAGDDAVANQPMIEAVLQLLAAIQVRPVLIGRGRNNGYLPASLGLRELALHLAQQTHDELAASGATTLLVLTPGDLFAFEQLHATRLGLSLPEGVAVMEVVTVLASALADGQLRLRRREGASNVAYLDPTHAARSGRDPETVRTLLAAILDQPARELFWSKERAHPLGATSLQQTHPQIAEMLTRARLADAQQTGVTTLLTEAPADVDLLNRHAAEYGIQVANLYEELAMLIESH